MKKVFSVCLLLLSILLLVSCSQEKTGRYGGTDVNGLTADEAVKKCYELFEKNDIDAIGAFLLKDNSIFDERIKLVSLDKCYVVEDYKPDEYDIWYKDTYAYCVVQTSAVVLCEEDCALGNKDERITLDYAYFLVMTEASSGWMIADYGYPPAVPVV